MRYFKPKKNLEYSCILRPQKVSIREKKKWRYAERDFQKTWVESDLCDGDLDLIKKNFIEVPSEAEAIAF